MNTEIHKDKYNGWTVETKIAIGDSRELQIDTYKYNGMLRTTAKVGIRHATGFRIAIGVAGSGDYYRVLMQTQTKATEKAVKAQHERVDIEAIKAEALAHYA